ncbi:tellurite resistance TerB C-terminal domain-containing protein, partial [Acetoanaerobium noterae]|uniref:tellurite resistance TerB C-terminal domain-containing protein n=1 Tax=Acetoanaerobium noterae TaxID=745369 RepID=UPI0032218398
YQLRPNVYEDIINLLQSYEAEDLLMDEAIRITGSNEKFNSILLLALKNTGEKERYPILFELLTFIEGFEFKTKILNQLFESDDTVTSLISALSLNASGKLKGAKLKKARESVHKTRLASFDELLSKGKNPVLEDLQDIKDLQYIHRKNIKLDLDKIDRSRVELSRVIENVKTIVGTDAEDEPDKNEIQKSAVSIIADVLAPDLAKTGVTDEVEDDHGSDNLISTLEENRIEFIKRVISKEGLKVKEAEEMADKEGTFLSTVIESINNLMYKTFDDQVLLIEGDFVIADEYYKEELTELMNGY